MVDFKKRLEKKARVKIIDPEVLYDTLDRASDKGPLRPAQTAVLKEWHDKLRKEQDIILKLHTGQGKTLIGLLMLLSKMNENGGSSLYLCPNKYLARQTFIQAHQFGIKCEIYEDDLSENFLSGTSILISHIQVLFNGKTKFGIGAKSKDVKNLVVDDAHACIDSIRDAFNINLNYQHPAYQEILALFSDDLKEQGVGTCANILNKEYGDFLPVPYWAWIDRAEDVARILSSNSATKEIKFVWPIIKDTIADCLCVISGQSLQIQPYLPPLHLFKSFDKASQRIFMSATVADDSFLVKGLGVNESVVKNPLIYKEEKWSGEKMLLIPSLIDSRLDRDVIVREFSKHETDRQYGVVILCPSFKISGDWDSKGANVATAESIEKEVEKLKRRKGELPLVIVNRYDGIDLPDRACRILIMDATPFAQNLIDIYLESVRGSHGVLASNTARAIEQGLGRSVRGEKDYCAIVIIGSDLVKFVRNSNTRALLSPQTQKQIEIGLEIADMAREEIEAGTQPIKALGVLIRQSLKRDEDWKEFYIKEMDQVENPRPSEKSLSIFSVEKSAEIHYRQQDFNKAISSIQGLIDKSIVDPTEKGWYLQEMARFAYKNSKIKSNDYQKAAHKANPYLLKPKEGMVITKLKMEQKRVQNLVNKISSFDSYEELSLFVDEMLGKLKFGTIADKFEKSFNDLGIMLGYSAQRPDKEWKAGPDNLWAIKKNTYLLVECKNEIKAGRAELYKEETGQMNNSCAWFKKEYPGASATNIIIAPTKNLGKAAGFNEAVSVMLPKNLAALVKNVKWFYQEFSSLDLGSLSEEKVEILLKAHKLTTEEILTSYATSPSS